MIWHIKIKGKNKKNFKIYRGFITLDRERDSNPRRCNPQGFSQGIHLDKTAALDRSAISPTQK